jgi:hypothetical protein
VGSGVKTIICPECKQPAQRAIYAGLPLRYCGNHETSVLWGAFSWVLNFIPFNGMLFVHECGYWRALWHWLFDSEKLNGGTP